MDINKYVNKIKGCHNPVIQTQVVDILYILPVFYNVYMHHIYYVFIYTHL